MNKLKSFILLISALILLSSCTTKNGSPTSLILNVDKTGVFVDNNVKPKNSGSSCSYSLWPWLTVGDSSINTAKEDAGISKVATIDASHVSFPALFFHFFRTCTVVTGE